MSALEHALRELLRDVVGSEVRAALAEERPRNAAVPVGAGGYLSITKAAREADVATGTIRAWIRAGRLPAKRAGRVYRVSRADLEAFLAASAAERRTPAAIDLTARAKELLRAA